VYVSVIRDIIFYICKSKSCRRGFPAKGDNLDVPVSRRIESWSHRMSHGHTEMSHVQIKINHVQGVSPQKVMFYLFMCHAGLSQGHAEMSHIQINHVSGLSHIQINHVSGLEYGSIYLNMAHSCVTFISIFKT